MNKFNVGVIGCGNISGIHMDALSALPDVTLYAVCDIDENKAAKAAEKYNCKYYTDYREMLKDSSIDSIHICTPHYLHAPMAIDSMFAGKHVLCEKPIAITSEDAQEMIRVSGETGKKLEICFQNRYNATSVKIKEILDSGSAGRILGAKAFVTWKRGKDYYASGAWRGTWEQEGGGVLINQSIHTLDLLQWFLGDIDKIKGNADTRLLGDYIEVEDTAEATIVFKNGATGLFYATNCYATDSPVEIEIFCEKAVLKLSDGLTVTYKDGRTEHITEADTKTGGKAYWGSGHAALIKDFYRRLGTGEDMPIDGFQALTSLKMIEAVYKSTKTREYVKF